MSRSLFTFHFSLFTLLQPFAGIIAFNRLRLYHYRRVAALHILAGGRHGAGDVAGAYQRTTGSNE